MKTKINKDTMKFYTRGLVGHDLYTPHGSVEEPEYQLQINADTGERRLVEVGKRNVVEEINAHAKDSTLDAIIARFKRGDTRGIRQGGWFADVSNLPTTMLEAHSQIQNLRTEFAKMPAEFKERFDNSFESWLNFSETATEDQKKGVVDSVNKVNEEVSSSGVEVAGTSNNQVGEANSKGEK